MVEKGKPLQAWEHLAEPSGANTVRVQVAGCGLCHTDIGFMFSEVPTRKALPVVLGHEISGTVLDGPLAGQQVLVPAVMPCGQCAACRAGYERTCPHQIMPGNDVHGGFGPWIEVPQSALVPLPQMISPTELAQFAVIADAVTTPLQAIHNLGLATHDVAIVIGCGGVGSFACLLAKARGAFVIAMDIDDNKLEKMKGLGIDETLNTRGLSFKDIKGFVKSVCQKNDWPAFGHRILETSGSKIGQETAFGLLSMAARMAVVGFTLDKVEVRLSNLMAFDAQVIGNWGASPSIYPEAIEIALTGALHLDQMTRLEPLQNINSIIENVHHHGTDRRVVFTP